MPGTKKIMTSEGVRATRAGDLFHYRWAAARALNLLQPESPLRSVTIEGTPTSSKYDYVIDVAESYEEKDVVYQLKYSILHSCDVCTLSFLKGTLEGYGRHFANLNKEHAKRTEYVFLTNRPVAQDVKDAFLKLDRNSKYYDSIKGYLNLPDEDTKQFCRQFKICDCVENSATQFKKVEQGLSRMISMSLDSEAALAFVEFIAEKAAEGRKVITKASLLSYLGCSQIEDLLPAPASLDGDNKIIRTASFARAMDEIEHSSSRKIIVHAAGGVGKTAFSQYFRSCEKVLGPVVLYDCYGGGLYRASNHSRHKIRDAFVEIINELYLLGFADPILKWRSASDDAIADILWQRIEQAVKLIRKRNAGACLYVVIDAADNAEIAAEEDGTKSFVRHLVRAEVPDGCRIIFTARSERLEFTQDDDSLQKVELGGLTPVEVQTLVRTKIAGADIEVASEVACFAKGNPRVILNLLAFCGTIAELRLAILPDKPNTVRGIVAQKLEAFWNAAKKTHSRAEQDKVLLLFDSLAVLPPAIPVNVLARVSGLDKSLVETFIADLGQSFRYENELVHFRDEPTEAYFRETYGQTDESRRRVLSAIEGHGLSNWYTALVIPKLLFELKEYDRLFELAKSETGIPESSKTEARNIRLMRLEYAYRAALKTRHFNDAVALSFLLGSENSGEERQRGLILSHLPYVATKFSEAEIDSLCRDRELSFGWEGSHNLVVAVLRAVRNKGGSVAEQYLKSAVEWLWECYDKYNDMSDERRRDYSLPSEQSLALILLALYYVRGIEKVAMFVRNWEQPIHRFTITRLFAQEMVSLGNVEDLSRMALGKNFDPGVCLALCLTLEHNGRSLGKAALTSVIQFLKSNVQFPNAFVLPREDYFTHAVMSACESAARYKELRADVLRIVESRILNCNNYWEGRSFEERNFVFLRAYALWLVLAQKKHGECNWEALIDKRFGKRSDYKRQEADKEIATRIEFYVAVEKCYIDASNANWIDVQREYDELASHYEVRDWEWHGFDTELMEVAARVRLQDNETAAEFDAMGWKAKRIPFARRLSVAQRLFGNGDYAIGMDLVRDVREKMFEAKSEFQIEEMAEWLIHMSKIICGKFDNEAKEYFDKAIEILSAVGDEALQHFDAITDLMRRACESKIEGRTVARYLRCAEHAYRYDSKHFDVKKAYDVVSRHNISDALASLSRLRDRGFYDFGYVLVGLLEKFVLFYGLTCRQVWAFRYFLSDYELLRLLEFVLEQETETSSRQYYVNEVVEWLSKRVEWVDEKWQTLAKLADKYRLDAKAIKPYLKILNASKRSDSVRLNIRRGNPRKKFDEAIRRIDYGSDNWLLKFYNAIEFGLGRGPALERLIEVIPNDKLKLLLHQLSASSGLPEWDVADVLQKFPREKLGERWRETWDEGVRKILFRFAAEGNVRGIGYLISCVQKGASRREFLEESLSRLSDTIGTSASHCYSMIGLISKVLDPDSALRLATSRIQDFEAELDEAFGDPQSVVNDSNDDTPVDALAALLWGALGSPVAWCRWNAAYCVSAMVINGSDNVVKGVCKCHEKFNEDRYMSSGASFYSGFAQMYFAIGLNNAAVKCPSNLDGMIEWLQQHAVRCHNAIIRWYYAEVLRKAHVALQKPSREALLQVKSAIMTRTPPIVLKSCFEHVPYAWDEALLDEGHGFVEYDVEKYWLPSLAGVFGIEQRPFTALFKRAFGRVASSHYDNWGQRLRYDYDKRDYRNETAVHSHGTYPRAFTFRTYASFMALGELSFELLGHFPTVIAPGEMDDHWEKWLKEHLLARADGYWLSDEGDAVPVCFISNQGFTTDLVQKPLAELKLGEVITIAAPSKGMLPVAGGWETQPVGNRVKVKYYCVIVPEGLGSAYLRKLTVNKVRYQYRIPVLYRALEKPPFVCKGKWRGILAEQESWDDNHFEQYDPNYGGFNRQKELVAPELVAALGVMESENGKVMKKGKHGIFRSVRWGTGDNMDDRKPRHVGSVLWMSEKAMRELKVKLACDIIIGAEVVQDTGERFQAGKYTPPQTEFIWRLIK